jgi:hypothetical protein
MPRARVQHQVKYSKTMELGNGQRFEMCANSKNGYFTTISRNVLKDAPVVVGPTDLNREQWLELAEVCTKIASLVKSRNIKEFFNPNSPLDSELY